MKEENNSAVNFLCHLLNHPTLPYCVSSDGTWGDIFFTRFHHDSPIFRSGKGTDKYLGFGSEFFASLIVQLYFSLHNSDLSFNYVPEPCYYSNQYQTIEDSHGSHIRLSEAVCGSGVDDLIPLILAHPDLEPNLKSKIEASLHDARNVHMMGCISPSSMIAFMKRLVELQLPTRHIHMVELSRTIPFLVREILKFYNLNQQLGITTSSTLVDLSLPPNPNNSYAAEYTLLEKQLGEQSIALADIIEYYMTDEQVIEGLGGNLRLYGSNGIILIRCLSQYSYIKPVERVITTNPENFNSNQGLLWNLLLQAGFTIDPTYFATQLAHMFDDSPPPLRSYTDIIKLFDKALTTPREGFPTHRRFFTAPVAKQGMDPSQRHYVLLGYAPVDSPLFN